MHTLPIIWKRTRTCTLTSSHGTLQCLLALDYTMMYLMRGSMREGKVAPGLWGPWTITDFSGWSDQMTLDYNFECVVCRRSHCLSDALTIMSHD